MNNSASVAERAAHINASSLWLLNSAVLPQPGVYCLRRIDAAEARSWCRSLPTKSAIGHAATAAWLSQTLDIPVRVNRCRATLEPGQRAIIARPTARLEEGHALTLDGLGRQDMELLLLLRLH